MAGDTEQVEREFPLEPISAPSARCSDRRGTLPRAQQKKWSRDLYSLLMIGKRSTANGTFGQLNNTRLTKMVTTRRQMKGLLGGEVKANRASVAFVEAGSHFKQLVGNVVRHPLGSLQPTI